PVCGKYKLPPGQLQSSTRQHSQTKQSSIESDLTSTPALPAWTETLLYSSAVQVQTLADVKLNQTEHVSDTSLTGSQRQSKSFHTNSDCKFTDHLVVLNSLNAHQ
ncbi:unnamed protein product, partial [Candidula unifasciata]